MTPSACLLAAALLAAAPPIRPERVVLVSIDALHPSALTATTMPNLFTQGRRGQITLDGRSTRPPKTLVAHTAMLTGLDPEASGKTDNAWESGQPTVEFPTVLDDARRAGYRTAFFYSKEKLGYLVTPGAQEHALAPEGGVAKGLRFLATQGPAFLVLHLSGLEYAGMEHGWLSTAYLARASELDRSLAPLFADLERRGSFLLVVTSDHAGHGLEHGTEHPEDGLRPLVARSDQRCFPPLDASASGITALRARLASCFIGDMR